MLSNALLWLISVLHLQVVVRSAMLPMDMRRTGALHIPISKQPNNVQERAGVSQSIGLGDVSDFTYSVPIQIGSTIAGVNIDTGSSDLWLISDKCTTNTCSGSNSTRFPTSSFTPVGNNPITLQYGDSVTGTFARGKVGRDQATIAGISIENQIFALVDDTSNGVVQDGLSGILGLGFPTGSILQESLLPSDGGSVNIDDFFNSIYDNGPVLTRMTATSALAEPIFSIMFQRDTVDISGAGSLTVGALPPGIDNSSLTWVPVRRYTQDEGGTPPPSFAPNEFYPFRWEIDIDAVFIDGQKLSDSQIPALDGVDSKRVSALIDTGNSLIRGPQDVVNTILSTVSSVNDPTSNPLLPCNTPHTLAFEIGGKIFPVDPRDFIRQNSAGDVTTCTANQLVATDPPQKNSLFRWSLGDPFLKSNVVAFYYGNLTHPSLDPPRIGFLSTVPADADDLLQQSVHDAQENGNNFSETSQSAPTASAAAEGQITVSPITISTTSQATSPTVPIVASLTTVPPTTTTVLVSVTPVLSSPQSQINSAKFHKSTRLDYLIYMLVPFTLFL